MKFKLLQEILFSKLVMKLSMGVTFEKLLPQSVQGHARNNPTKFEVLTPSLSSVF